MLFNFLISQFELTAIGLLLVILYASTNIFGRSAIYLLTGVYFVVATLTDMPDVIGYALASGNYHNFVSGTVWFPLLLLFILTYEKENTLAAHRLFFGMIIVYVFFLCLSTLFANEEGIQQNFLHTLLTLQGSRILISGLSTYATVMTSVHLALFLVLPIVHQILRNKRAPYFLSIFAAISAYMLLNDVLSTLFFTIMLQADWGHFFKMLATPAWFQRFITITIFSLIGQIFLAWQGKSRVPFFRKNMAFLTDLTTYLKDANQMRQNIEQWTERYKLVLAHTNEMICILDCEGAFVNVNPRTFDYLGKSATDSSFRIWNIISDDDGQSIEWADIYARLIDRKNYRHEIDFINMRLNISESHFVDIDIHTKLVETEGTTSVLMIVTDVTARREDERKRLGMAEAMMHAQRLESLGMLAGGVAHEFNNLLQSCRASLDMIFEHGKLMQEDRKLLNNVSEACSRSATLTSQLLGFARKGKRTEAPVEVKELVDRTLELFRPLAKKIKVKVISQPAPLIVLGDDKQIGQVLLNLLINSRDACKDVEDPMIVLRLEVASDDMPGWELRPRRQGPAEEFLRIQVRDNGCGMTTEVQKKLFEPFFTTKGPGMGTGMGLPMVFGTLTEHNGWVNVISAPGQGATFELFLPRITE